MNGEFDLGGSGVQFGGVSISVKDIIERNDGLDVYTVKDLSTKEEKEVYTLEEVYSIIDSIISLGHKYSVLKEEE